MSADYHTLSSSDAVYEYWFDLYLALSTLPIDRTEVRHSDEVIQRLRAAGWDTSARLFDQYWHRVGWTARQSRGRVLEIGAGMGTITRWIASNPEVSAVVALEVQPRYVRILDGFAFPKTTAMQADALRDTERIAPHGPFDTVVLAEFIEHLAPGQELALLRALRRHLAPGARWVVTTPIGFMPDPDHKRGFSPRLFRLRSELLYGAIEETGHNGIQQFVACRTGRHSASTRLARETLARILDWGFDARPPGALARALASARPLARGLARRAYRRVRLLARTETGR